MSNHKHTSGEWICNDASSHITSTIKIIAGGPHKELLVAEALIIDSVADVPIRGEESRANAELIAEAGTIANETGFTPRQLADMLQEKTEDCKNLADGMKHLNRVTALLREQKEELLEALNEANEQLKNVYEYCHTVRRQVLEGGSASVLDIDNLDDVMLAGKKAEKAIKNANE